MKAGRELDKLIAEKVLGWKYDEETNTFHDGYIGVKVDEFKPSEQIADAWLVVDKLRERRVFHIHDALDEEDNKIYYANFQYNDGFHNIDYGEYAKSAPLAICLAALNAVGVE